MGDLSFIDKMIDTYQRNNNDQSFYLWKDKLSSNNSNQ